MTNYSDKFDFVRVIGDTLVKCGAFFKTLPSLGKDLPTLLHVQKECANMSSELITLLCHDSVSKATMACAILQEQNTHFSE